MTSDANLLRFRDRMTPDQAMFVDMFVAPDAARNHLLVAPTGTGKSMVAIAILSELSKANLSLRALVLVPGVLTDQYAQRLSAENVPAVIVRRQQFRELESRTTMGQTLWPESIVAIMPIDVAKHVDVREGLGNTHWDVVVIDEAHRLAGQREELAKLLVSKDAAQRLLLITGTPPADWLAGLGAEMVVTVWNPRVMRKWDGSPLYQPTQFEFIQYTRSEPERKFLDALTGLVEMIVPDPKAGRSSATLLRRAQSSLVSLDSVLLEIQGALMEQPTGAASGTTSEPEEDEPSDVWAHINWVERGQAQQQVSRLLDLLSQIDADTKLDALRHAVAEWQRSSSQPVRICVFCAYSDTAEYVAESLRGQLESSVHCVTGSTDPAARGSAIGAFAGSDSAVLVVTDAVLQGFDLPEVSHAVNYDLPWSPMAVEQRRGRVDRMGRSRQLHFLFLDDGSAASWLSRLEERLRETETSDPPVLL